MRDEVLVARLKKCDVLKWFARVQSSMKVIVCDFEGSSPGLTVDSESYSDYLVAAGNPSFAGLVSGQIVLGISYLIQASGLTLQMPCSV